MPKSSRPRPSFLRHLIAHLLLHLCCILHSIPRLHLLVFTFSSHRVLPPSLFAAFLSTSKMEELNRLVDQILLDEDEQGETPASDYNRRLFDFKTRPMSEGDSNAVSAILNAPPYRKTVAQFGNLAVSFADLHCLRPRCWLNDEVINFYMALLQKRSDSMPSSPSIESPASARREAGKGRQSAQNMNKRHFFFNTFFFASLSGGAGGRYDYSKVRRWTTRKKVDIFSLQKIFVPINVNNNHWTLAVIDFPARRILYYDSLMGRNDRALDCLQRYVLDEYSDKKGGLCPEKESALLMEKVHVAQMPTQNNGFDCGVFLCKATDFLADEMLLLYHQKDMPLFRQRIALEILSLKTDGEAFYERKWGQNDFP